MPRCAGCRGWVIGWIAVAAIVAVAAGIAGAFVQSVFFSSAASPSWLKIHHEGIGNIGTGVGILPGFVAALLAMASERKRSERQSANTYLPVVSLRKLGWASYRTSGTLIGTIAMRGVSVGGYETMICEVSDRAFGVRVR